eukprot:TRINITY_DN101269_c0_g1_i1.p1 TRINITY_DN101269_c0_g1~~TRINITY_DN101269_c0_g1_i1.p1  ORF type:complete len:126 (+),score=29.32 TRINITY_DN101269_c0_g1_i1:25-378(+)
MAQKSLQTQPYKFDIQNPALQKALLESRFQGFSARNPLLKCHETRIARDRCLLGHGHCEYKIEDHFKCLEQHYPKERVERLRGQFSNNAFDIWTDPKYEDKLNYSQNWNDFPNDVEH